VELSLLKLNEDLRSFPKPKNIFLKSHFTFPIQPGFFFGGAEHGKFNRIGRLLPTLIDRIEDYSTTPLRAG
jgi:hypothetical protein